MSNPWLFVTDIVTVRVMGACAQCASAVVRDVQGSVSNEDAVEGLVRCNCLWTWSAPTQERLKGEYKHKLPSMNTLTGPIRSSYSLVFFNRASIDAVLLFGGAHYTHILQLGRKLEGYY